VGPSFFVHFGKRLAHRAAIATDSKVLDVATGTGAVLVPAAELVGAEGKVIGVDISPRMIGRVRTEILKVGLNNAEVLIADGERLPFVQGRQREYTVGGSTARHVEIIVQNGARAVGTVRTEVL
jgi:ubiquinone/menaquinone biosynthesis C-methylase UbiE